MAVSDRPPAEAVDGAGGAGAAGGGVPAPLLVLGAATSVQFGASFAVLLFDDAGPGGTVLLRLALAAVVLVVLWRPALRGQADLRGVLAFGAATGLMNLLYYLAIDRIPLGIAVTLEFVGPLGVALWASRRRRDLVWVALAAVGIVLLADGGTESLDLVGCLFALSAGACWAAYILLSARVGKAYPGGTGLALAMVVGAVVVLPFGVVDGGAALLAPEVLALGFAVALLSSVIPYSLELEALRRIPEGLFGVLMSLEPALAALAGFLVLGQDLGLLALAGIALVVAASAGASRTHSVTGRAPS